MKKWLVSGLIGAGVGTISLAIIGFLMLASIGSGSPQWNIALSTFMVGVLSSISGFLVSAGFSQKFASEITVHIIFLLFTTIGFSIGALIGLFLDRQTTFKRKS